MNFLSYLFKSIPKLLFEPIAVGTLLWFIFAIFFFRKHNKMLFWMVFASIVFMLSWRLGFSMKSSRYAFFLIYPAVIFTACFYFKISIILRWIFQRLKWKVPHKHSLCKILPVLILLGVVAACIGKTLHRNPYGNFLHDITQTYWKHSGGKGIIHAQGVMRLSWYIGRNFKNVEKLGLPEGNDVLPFIQKAVSKAQNTPGNHYFFYYLKKGEPEPNSESMKNELAGGGWHILGRRWVSPRKNNEFVLALHKPTSAYIDEWSGKIPNLPKNNLIQNGDFENPLTGTELKHQLNSYKKTGFLSYADPSRLQPANWHFFLGADPKSPPDLHLDANNVLAGTYSLYADTSKSKYPFVLCSSPVKKGNTDFHYNFFIRNNGESDSKVRFLIIAWLKDKKRDYFIKNLTLDLEKEKTYRISGTIKKDQIPSTADEFYIYLCAKGIYTLDQFCIVKNPPEN